MFLCSILFLSFDSAFAALFFLIFIIAVDIFTFRKEISPIMRKVIKKSEPVYAYQLGAGSDAEKEMIAEGKIRLMPDGSFELFSQEAFLRHGETALPGDYFKIDSSGYPYPNQKEWFEENHRHFGADRYLQISKPLDAWESGDDISEEIQFLLDTRRMTLHPDDEAHYFRAFLWGAPPCRGKKCDSDTLSCRSR